MQSARAQWPWHGALLAACLALGAMAGANPALAVGAALAAAFALAVTASLIVGLCVFSLVALAERLPGLAGSDVTLVKALGAALALSWLAAVATGRVGNRQLLTRHPAATVLGGLLLAWMLLSVGWSEDTGVARGDVLRYALNLALLPIVFAAVRGRRDALAVCAVFVAGAVASALYALAVGETEDGLTRISGVAGTANELASLLVAAIILAGGLALAARGAPLARALALAAAGVCLLALFLTLSRAGLVALAAALVTSVFLSGRWRAGALIVAVLVAFAALGYFSVVAPERARERVTTIGDGTGRTDIWTIAWRMIADKPVTGVGIGNFQTASIHYLLEPGAIRRDEFILDRPQVAHNSYLQVQAELGLPGLALFCALLAWGLMCAWRAARLFARRGDPALELIARAVVLALVALLVANLFASDQLNKLLWLLLGLGPALLAIAREAEPAADVA